MSASLGSDEASSYLRRIELRFRQLRGQPLLVSPRDWALMLEWLSLEIPVEVVIAGLESCFEQSEPDRVRTIAYCRASVQRAWKDHRESRLGASDDAHPLADVETVRERARERVQTTVEILAELAGGDAPPALREMLADTESWLGARARSARAIDRRLGELDRELMAALRELIDERDRDELTAAAERELEPYRARMSADAYRRTLRHAFDRRLREQTGLPRLGLLY